MTINQTQGEINPIPIAAQKPKPPEPVFKPERKVLDPLNRVVEVVRTEGWDHEGKPLVIHVRLAGSYGATVWYPRSMLRAVPEDLL